MIAQEHQATVVISNMAALIEHEAQMRWEERRARGEVRRKHAKDKINTSVAVGLWKDRGIAIVLDPDPDRRIQAYWNLVESMQVLALMQFVITSANFHAIPGLRRGLSDGHRTIVRECCFSRPKGGDSGLVNGSGL